MSLEEYEVRESRDDEKAQLVPFVYQHSYNHMFTLYLEAHGKHYDDECRLFFVKEHLPISDLLSVPSIIAVHRGTGKICGFCLVYLTPNREHSGPPPEIPPGGLFSEWLQAVIGPTLAVDLGKMFPAVKRLAELRQLLVSDEHRRRGLGAALFAEAIELARRRNVQLMHGLFTSPISQYLAEKAGFRSVADFDVADARDGKGEIMYPGVGSFVYSKMVKEL